MDKKNKGLEKIEIDDLNKVAGGLSIGGKKLNSTTIDKDLSKGDVDIKFTVGGRGRGRMQITQSIPDVSNGIDAESESVEPFPESDYISDITDVPAIDENLIPFDPNI